MNENAAAERAVVGRTMRWAIRITRFGGLGPLTLDALALADDRSSG